MVSMVATGLSIKCATGGSTASPYRPRISRNSGSGRTTGTPARPGRIPQHRSPRFQRHQGIVRQVQQGRLQLHRQIFHSGDTRQGFLRLYPDESFFQGSGSCHPATPAASKPASTISTTTVFNRDTSRFGQQQTPSSLYHPCEVLLRLHGRDSGRFTSRTSATASTTPWLS